MGSPAPISNPRKIPVHLTAQDTQTVQPPSDTLSPHYVWIVVRCTEVVMKALMTETGIQEETEVTQKEEIH